MDCSEFRSMLDSYLDETIEEEQRPEFRRHLRECSSCGKMARSADPSLLFAMADSGPVDLARVESCSVAVVGQIRQQRLERRMRGYRRPWLAAVAAVAVAIVGVVGWQLAPGVGGPEPVVSLDAETPPGVEAEPPTVEIEMPGADVRVYQFANEEDDDTAVYFIVNPALEL